VCRRSDVRDEATIITQWPGLPEGAVLVQMEGRVDGVIARTESGQGGFGYDPLFFVPELGCTFAEVPSDEKHALSHRGQAFRRLLNVLEERTSLKKTTRDLDLSSGS
jgi:non-canonical purine NTP pyrophosphatase (RdgB/HAM1 family)